MVLYGTGQVSEWEGLSSFHAGLAHIEKHGTELLRRFVMFSLTIKLE